MDSSQGHKVAAAPGGFVEAEGSRLWRFPGGCMYFLSHFDLNFLQASGTSRNGCVCSEMEQVVWEDQM